MRGVDANRPGTGPDAALAEILAALDLAVGTGRAVCLLRDAAAAGLRVAAVHGLPSGALEDLQSSFYAADGLPYAARAGCERSGMFLENPARDPETPTPLIEHLGDGPQLVVPLLSPDAKMIGTMHVACDQRPPERSEWIAAVARAAATIATNDSAESGYEEETRRDQALLAMFEQMSRSGALPQVLDGICRKTVEAFGVDCAAIFDLAEAGGNTVLLANHGTPPDTAERFVRFGYSAGRIPRQADFDAGKPAVVSPATGATPEEQVWLQSLRLHSAAILPLKSGASLGALAAGISDRRSFTAAQLLGLEVVAHHATTAMMLARFLGNAESAVRFRAAVSALAVEINAQSDRARALRLLCARGRVIFNAAWGAVLMQSGDELLEMAADGALGEAPEALSVPTIDPTHPAARAFSTGEVITEAGEDRHARHCALAVPLAGPDGPVGVLLFRNLRDSRGSWPGMAGDARILGALAGAVLRNLDLLARLHRANADLKRANTLKDQLLANASHDLRTPLNVIIGYGQLAIEGTFGEAPEELQDVLSRMVNSACEQLSLVEDLLNLSRIELNVLPVNPTEVAVGPLFSEMEFVIANLVQGRPIRPLVQPAPEALYIRADADRVRQILTNLVTNAAKFTDNGCIELSATTDAARVTLAVRDTGIGISDEDQKTVFDAFTQVEGERTGKGAGLGLAIARRLAHMMSGNLAVDSEVGKGSTFSLTLPRVVGPGADTPAGAIAAPAVTAEGSR